MAQPAEVTIKALAGAQSLEGAFRLHLTPESLEQAGLKLGDLAELNNVDGTAVGVGIAWRAADRARSGNPSTKPVFTSEILWTAYNVAEGQRLSVRKTTIQQSRASKVVLQDVTPPENLSKSGNEVDNEQWKIRIAYQLANLEAFTNGITIDVLAKNKTKKRFEISSISSSNTSCWLYFVNDLTEIVIDESSTKIEGTTATAAATGRLLSSDNIGGLVDQLQDLNERMQSVLDAFQEPELEPLDLVHNNGILLHGFEGTGRTFLLQQLECAPFRRVLRLDVTTVMGSGVKVQDRIRSIFQEAKVHQPSLILADNLQKVAPPSEHATADCLSLQMDSLRGHRVLAIATCSTPNDVHSELLDEGRLPVLIELPIPDRSTRKAILDIMLRKTAKQHGLTVAVALRTHGFTGKDLRRLVGRAKEISGKRTKEAIARARNDALANGVIGETSSAVNAIQNGLNGKHEAGGPNRGERVAAGALSMDDFVLAFGKVRPTALREIIFETPKIGWADIGGSADTKKHFDKALDWPIHHADILKKYNKRPAKGILLYGPPGCSKTLTAQAVASHYGLNFIAVKGGELISMYVGESERKIRELFSKARQAAPCVIFFDEIDSIASERQSDSSKGLNVLTTLLTEMDGFEALNGVLVLAATNKPELLDAAIMRPGRFGVHIYLGPPDAAARKEIFAIGLRGKPVEDGLDIDKLVDISNGYSGAEIAQICENAIDQVIQREVESDARTLCMDDLETAIAKQKKSITDDDLASFKAFSAS